MKSEERILELLSEYLHKTDRTLERMEKTDRNVEIMSKAILDQSLNIRRLSEENNQMLKELISISKRVSNLEEKG